MNILVIVPSVPYPLDSGSPIRNFNLIRELSRNHSITLLALAHRPADLRNVENLRPYCERIEAIPHFRSAGRKLADFAASFFLHQPYIVQANTNRNLRQLIPRLIVEQKIKMVHLAELYTAGNIDRIHLGVPLIFDAHNCEGLVLSRLSKAKGRPVRSIYWRNQAEKLEAFEARICCRADCVFSVSPDEKLYFQGISRRVELVPNGVPAGESAPSQNLKPRAHPQAPPQILFTGTLSYPPNADAISFFLRSIWPLIKKEMQDARFVIVGRRPPAGLQNQILRAGDGVTLLTDIDDIEPFFAESAAMVVPLRAGAGTRIKILEAFSKGLPVISTSIGAEGLEIVDQKHALIADAPESFAAGVLKILRNSEAAAGLTDEALKLVREKYQWPDIVSRSQAVYRELAQ